MQDGRGKSHPFSPRVVVFVVFCSLITFSFSGLFVVSDSNSISHDVSWSQLPVISAGPRPGVLVPVGGRDGGAGPLGDDLRDGGPLSGLVTATASTLGRDGGLTGGLSDSGLRGEE